jgi:hypothetical protein
LNGRKYYTLGHEIKVYSYEKIHVNESLTHVNVVVVEPPFFGHTIVSIKNGKIVVKV